MNALPASVAALLLYLGLFLVVDRAHPDHPVPIRRLAAWGSGLAVAAVALGGPLAAASEASFAAHMVQHLLLIMVCAPLLLLGAPVTLLLRAAGPTWRRRILAALESRAVAIVAWHPLGWFGMAAVMWWAHLGPLFEAALERPPVHVAEHALFLAAALLFWRPVVGVDPGPFRLGHGGRLAYLSLAMAPNLLLGMVLYAEGAVLYPTYAVSAGALADQRLGATIMWVGGDLLFTLALGLVVAAWMRSERARLERAAAIGRPAGTAGREAGSG